MGREQLTGISTGDGLQVVFQQDGDRYAHRIEYRESGRVVRLLESLEGSDSDAWPPSPPLQQFSIEPREAGDVALLVGMAGKSHWSASIQADSAQQQLVFDVACRVRDTPDRLASGYRLGPACAVTSAARSLKIVFPGGVAWLACDVSGEAACHVRGQDGQWLIEPSAPLRAGTTLRWRYTIQLIQSGTAAPTS